MTVFWSIAALLAAVALAFVLPALLGRRRATGAATADAANVAIHRDQLKELDADLAAGTLSPEQRDEARREALDHACNLLPCDPMPVTGRRAGRQRGRIADCKIQQQRRNGQRRGHRHARPSSTRRDGAGAVAGA